jgi:hypothetical protein
VGELAREVGDLLPCGELLQVRVSGSVERKSRTAGLSSSIANSTTVDPAEKRTTVPMTSSPASPDPGDVAGGMDGVPGALADADSTSGLDERLTADDAPSPAPPPQATSENIVAAAIGGPKRHLAPCESRTDRRLVLIMVVAPML